MLVFSFFLAVLGLQCCVGFPLVAESRGYSSLQCTCFSLWWLLLSQNMGSRARGLQQLWHVGSVAVVPGFSGSAARGIFPNQGSNPCLLHWQVDSIPLIHQESPKRDDLNKLPPILLCSWKCLIHTIFWKIHVAITLNMLLAGKDGLLSAWAFLSCRQGMHTGWWTPTTGMASGVWDLSPESRGGAGTLAALCSWEKMCVKYLWAHEGFQWTMWQHALRVTPPAGPEAEDVPLGHGAISAGTLVWQEQSKGKKTPGHQTQKGSWIAPGALRRNTLRLATVQATIPQKEHTRQFMWASPVAQCWRTRLPVQ